MLHALAPACLCTSFHPPSSCRQRCGIIWCASGRFSRPYLSTRNAAAPPGRPLANSTGEPHQSRRAGHAPRLPQFVSRPGAQAKRDTIMDINALLSPSESGSRESSASATPSPRAFRSARPAGGKRTTSALSNEVQRQPEAFPSRPTSAHFASPASFVGGQGAVAAPNFRPLQPPTSNPSAGAAHSSPAVAGFAQPRPVIAHRPSSTPELNALACKSTHDVASLVNCRAKKC